MITGPATKITNLGAVKIVLGVKRFALYLAFTILFALATGWQQQIGVCIPALWCGETGEVEKALLVIERTNQQASRCAAQMQFPFL